MLIKNLPIIIIIIFTLISCETDQKTTDPKLTEARRMVDSTMEAHNLVGLAITIIKDGNIIFSEGFGYANLEAQTQVHPENTMFRVGSISKPMTVTAIAKLYEEGKLDIYEDARKYVPYFPKKRYDFTIKQLAGHMAGIRHYNYSTPGEYISKKRYTSVKESLNVFKDDSLVYKPGEQWKYSSFGFNLLSAVVEGASGQDFTAYLEEELFTPIGMNHTSPDYSDSVVVGRTGFYEFDSASMKIINGEFADNSYKWAGGGFLSSSVDLARFGWAWHSNQIVSDSIKQLFTTHTHLNNGEENRYALGWTDTGTDVFGKRNYGHGGGAVGGGALLRIYLDDNLVIAFTKNTWKDGDIRGVIPKLVELYTNSEE